MLRIALPVLLTAAGLAYVLASARRYPLLAGMLAGAVLLALGVGHGAGGPVAASYTAPTTAALFWAGLKGGLLTFGGAYTAIPFIRQDLVSRGWVTDATFLDGVALANILPAPLVIYCDVSLKIYDEVIPAGGSTHASVRLPLSRLVELCGGQWADACDVPEHP